MLSFILGAFFGALVMFAARLADKNITVIVERYGKTGKLTPKKPIIIQPNDPVQDFIEDTFDPEQR